MRTILRLLGYTRKYWWLLALAFICMIGAVSFTLVIPRMLGRAIDSAIMSFQQAIFINDQNSLAFFYLGLSQTMLQKYELAKKNFEKILDLNTNKYLGFFGLGNLSLIEFDIDRAIIYYKKSLKHNPEFKAPLKSAGLLKRDPREKERMKYGLAKRRKRFQLSKR